MRHVIRKENSRRRVIPAALPHLIKRRRDPVHADCRLLYVLCLPPASSSLACTATFEPLACFFHFVPPFETNAFSRGGTEC